EKAHGEWILFIDADEFFPDDVCGKVRLNVMRNSHRRDIAGLLCRRENVDSVTGKMLSGCMILPIFRNIPNLRYEGRIHELLRDVSGGSPSLMVAEDIHTIHTGFSSDRQEEKYRRNIDMILRERERRGEKRDDAIYLSDGYYGIGDYESAARWAKRAIDDGVVAVGMEGRTYLILIESMIFMKKPLDTILDTAREAEEKFPGHAEFPMLAGIALCEAGLHERGAGELQRGIKMNDENIVKGSKAGSDAAKVLLPSARNYAEEAKKHIKSSKKHIKISACVITKNEEKNLPAWLSCVKKIADEIIVVDTGSDDGTVAVAKNGGAKVFHFEWINDFAAAKNYAIDRADGDWIVFLDADETFPAKDCPKVREWIRSSDKDEKNVAMMFRRIEIDSDTGTVKGSTLVVRAFRNLPTLRYEGRIHEVLVTEEKTKPALIFNPDVVINHTGYSSSVMREKLERNLDILLSEEKRRGKMPSDDFYLADCYFGLKQFEKAAECARRAIDSDVSLFGDSGRAYSVLIQSLSGMGKLREALDAAREAQKKFPDLPEFLVQGGLLRYQMKDYDEAARELTDGMAIYRHAIAGRQNGRIADDGCAPLVKFAESALREIKKIRDEAGAKKVKKNKSGEKYLASCREAVYDALDRKDYGAAKIAIDELMKVSEREALGLYVNLFIEMNDASNARKALDAYLPTAPKDVYTRFLSARVRLMTGEHLKVIEELRPIEDDKSIDGATREKILNLLGQCYRFIGDSEKATKAYLEASRVTKDKMLAALEYSDYLFNSHYLPVVSLSDEREKAAVYDKFFAGVNRFYHRRRYPKEKGEKIKIGYISPDIRNHVVLRFSLAFFMNYDRERYTVIVYMNGAEDAWSDKIHETADGWCNITGLPPERVARCIYDDGIDILVDLAGHTKNNSLPALSYKPAPIIVSGIGYFASTGLSAVDYFIGDVFLDGDGESPEQQEAFTEKLLVLPRSHFCYAPLYRAPDIGDAPCTKNGFITFGSFNNFTKVNDDVLGTWRIIMEQVPGSRLLLKAGVFASEDTRSYVIERLKRAGIDIDRVDMRPLTRDYLAEYNDVDIALDTFPYPGGGTSCDALYMGVPLVTLAGVTHGGRFGASLMANIGMAELVASNVEEYVARAVSLANDTELLSVMRKTMRRMMQRSPLMDAGRYMKDVECAYEKIYADFVIEPNATS
ncbi:MAG: glycosyltransferase, partial [Schwartzia sp.]|nr:glycosyltransferase [Schwartzia sp. (in: firmicutes)]